MVRLDIVRQPLDALQLPAPRGHASPVSRGRHAVLVADLAVAGRAVELDCGIDFGIWPPWLLHVLPDIAVGLRVRRRAGEQHRDHDHAFHGSASCWPLVAADQGAGSDAPDYKCDRSAALAHRHASDGYRAQAKRATISIVKDIPNDAFACFIAPKGWRIPLAKLQPLLASSKSDVTFNVMFEFMLKKIPRHSWCISLSHCESPQLIRCRTIADVAMLHFINRSR